MQGPLQIGTAAQAAVADELNGALNAFAGVRQSSPAHLRLGIEEHQAEVIRGAQACAAEFREPGSCAPASPIAWRAKYRTARSPSSARISGARCCVRTERSAPKSEQRLSLEETRLVGAADGRGLGRRRLAADRISVRQNLQRVRRRRIQIVGRDKVFAEIDVLSFEVAVHQVRACSARVAEESFGRRLEVADGVRGVQFEIDAKMARSLGLIGIGRSGMAKYDLKFSTGIDS